MITTEAQYPGVCAECAGKIRPGDAITSASGGGRWQHVTCPPAKFDVVREMCPGCFTERSVTGACLCGVVS